MITVQIVLNDDEVLEEYTVDMELGSTKKGRPLYEPDKYKVPYIKSVFETLPSLQRRRIGIHGSDSSDTKGVSK